MRELRLLFIVVQRAQVLRPEHLDHELVGDPGELRRLDDAQPLLGLLSLEDHLRCRPVPDHLILQWITLLATSHIVMHGRLHTRSNNEAGDLKVAEN